MTVTERKGCFSGTANLVLVLGQEQDATAVLSRVVVYAFEQENGERICFTGPATFHKKTAKHLKEVVLPIVDQILEALSLPLKNFEICVANIEASSINDIGLNISGNSLDVPVLVGMLSAALEIPVNKEIISTGHIASLHGDIRMVSGLPAKLKAAIDSGLITTFVHPAIDQDGSLDSLSPKAKQNIAGAIAMAKPSIRLAGVRDINDLVKAVFSDEQIVLGSLKKGFYEGFTLGPRTDSPIGKAAKFLGLNNTLRFWKALERELLEDRNEDAKGLFQVFAQFYIHRKRYPKGFGHRILQLLQSLPPVTRRLKVVFPLLRMSECIRLSQFAQESDFEDVPLLFRAVSGRVAAPLGKGAKKSDSGSEREDENGARKLDLVLSEMDEEVLTLIGLPIDSARAAYTMESITVKSYDAFLETITSFYIHLMRYTEKVSDPVDRNVSGAEAIALLERAFSRDGGLNEALSEAKNGTNGGLRLVLDMMTARFKREEKEKHVNLVLKLALDPLDWEGKVALMGALLKRLELHLTPEIVSQPPERYAGHYETIVRAYVQSMDQVKSLLRAL